MWPLRCLAHTNSPFFFVSFYNALFKKENGTLRCLDWTLSGGSVERQLREERRSTCVYLFRQSAPLRNTSFPGYNARFKLPLSLLPLPSLSSKKKGHQAACSSIGSSPKSRPLETLWSLVRIRRVLERSGLKHPPWPLPPTTTLMVGHQILRRGPSIRHPPSRSTSTSAAS